jgi:hypothetical protein
MDCCKKLIQHSVPPKKHSQSAGSHLRSRAAYYLAGNISQLTLPEILASRREPAHTNRMAAPKAKSMHLWPIRRFSLQFEVVFNAKAVHP